MQLGVDSFAASISDPVTGVTLDPVERMQNLLEEIELAAKVGLDAFGIGEHHRAEFLDSAGPNGKSGAHLDRCRRHARVIRSRRYARSSADGRYHRWRTQKIPPAHRSLSRGRPPRRSSS